MKLGSSEAGKLEGWEAGRPGSDEVGKLRGWDDGKMRESGLAG
jgi:hypothetical protein